MKVALVDGDDSYRNCDYSLAGGKVQASCSRQAAVGTHHRAGRNNHAGREALQLYCAYSSRVQPPSNPNTSTQPRQRQNRHVFAIVTYAYRIIIAATRPNFSMPLPHRDDTVLSFTNSVTTLSVEPFADQLNRITILDQLNRSPPVRAMVNAERNAELFKEVLRT